MYLTARRRLAFKVKGQNTFVTPAKLGEVFEAPDWIRESAMYKAAIGTGVITETTRSGIIATGPLGFPVPPPPPVEQPPEPPPVEPPPPPTEPETIPGPPDEPEEGEDEEWDEDDDGTQSLMPGLGG